MTYAVGSNTFLQQKKKEKKGSRSAYGLDFSLKAEWRKRGK